MSIEPINLIVTLRKPEEIEACEAEIQALKAENLRLRSEIRTIQDAQFELIKAYDRIREAKKLLKQNGLPYHFLD